VQAVALENIRILQDEKIVETCKPTPRPIWRSDGLNWASTVLVGEARIAGMVGALELVPDKKQRKFFPERGKVGRLCRDTR
jgi:putrescine aminotransferase